MGMWRSPRSPGQFSGTVPPLRKKKEDARQARIEANAQRKLERDACREASSSRGWEGSFVVIQAAWEDKLRMGEIIACRNATSRRLPCSCGLSDNFRIQYVDGSVTAWREEEEFTPLQAFLGHEAGLYEDSFTVTCKTVQPDLGIEPFHIRVQGRYTGLLVKCIALRAMIKEQHLTEEQRPMIAGTALRWPSHIFHFNNV